jgi:anti-sigma factor RsiW
MSTERPPYPDEWLSAYVDGELDADEQARVAAWLREQPEAAARVAAWRADREALLQHFAPALHEPVPAALRATVWRQQPPRWALAAAAAGLLLAGGVLGAMLADRMAEHRHAEQTTRLRGELAARLAAGTADGWVQRAAYAHTVYVAEPRHAVEVKAQEEHLARWLTRRIEVPVKLFDLSEQGFELVGGRLLPDGPGKSAQLMYQRTGEPGAPPQRVTVYLRKPEQGADTAFRFEQQGKVGLFYWVEEGAGYALVGELPRATLLALAQAIYAQHPALTAAPAPASAASR